MSASLGTTQLSHPHQATLAGRLNHQQVEDFLEGLFQRLNLVLECGTGWMQPDPGGCSFLVLLHCHLPLLSKGGDVAGGNSSCWELCVGLVPNRAEEYNGLGIF